MRLRGLWSCGALLSLLACPARSDPLTIEDFAVFARGTLNLNSGQGGVHAIGNIGATNNISFNGGSSVAGDVYSGRDVTFQGSPGNAVTGDVLANRNVTVNSVSLIGGTIYYGGAYLDQDNSPSTSYTNAKATTPPFPDLITFLPVPAAPTGPSRGNVNNDTAGANLVLQTGVYQSFNNNGQGANLLLSAGDYRFQNFNMGSLPNLYFDLTNGPIQIFLDGFLNYSSRTDVFILAEGFDGYVALADLLEQDAALARELALGVRWYGAQGMSINGGQFSTDPTEFFGIFQAASALEVGKTLNGNGYALGAGSLWGGDVNLSGVTVLNAQARPAEAGAPEPHAALLVGAGGAALLLVRRARPVAV